MAKSVDDKSKFLWAAIASDGLPLLPPGEEIYDLRGPVAVPYPWLQTCLQIAIALICCWIIVVVVRRLFSPGVIKEKPLPPIDHLAEALAALDRLKNSPIWHQGAVKDICEHITQILKVFLKNKFSLGLGCAATSDELVFDLHRNRVPDKLNNLVTELFSICDTVKFARGTLGSTTIDDLFTQVRTLLLRGDWRR